MSWFKLSPSSTITQIMTFLGGVRNIKVDYVIDYS